MKRRLSTAEIIASDLDPEQKIYALLNRLRETVPELRSDHPPSGYHVAARIDLVVPALEQLIAWLKESK